MIADLPCLHLSCRQVVEAFDVLINEEQRAVYDKCRDYQVGKGGKGEGEIGREEENWKGEGQSLACQVASRWLSAGRA